MSSRKTKSSSVIRKATRGAQFERLEDRQYYSSSHDIGINVNQTTVASFNKAVPILNTLGVTSVRLWCGVNSLGSRTMNAAMQRAIDYHNAGFDVTLTVALDDTSVPNPSAVKSWFQWAASNKALTQAVDRWEIGNEVDSSNYFKGTLKQYVSNELIPASQALHAVGETVVSAGVSWNPQDIQTLINDGMLNYVDAIGFHPYANGVASQKQHIDQVNAIVAGRKPLIATEWNVRGFENNKTAWSQAVQDAYANVHNGFSLDYYFCLFTQNTPAGPGGLINAGSYTINQPFYNAFVNAIHGTSAQPPVTSTGGSTSSGTAASISGVLWNDTNANGVWDSSESATGSRMVFIDSNGNGRLDSGELSTTSDAKGDYKFTGLKAGNYNVTRVYPDGYRISNSDKAYLTVTVTANHQLNGVDLGTTDAPIKSSGSSSGNSSGNSSNPSSNPSGNSSGNTSAGIGATIAGVLWNDTNGDGAWNSGESATGSRVVFIDSNGNGRLDSGEVSTTSDANGYYKFTGLKAGSYNITRVYPDGYRISNSAKAYVAVAVATDQQISNVNLGTTDAPIKSSGSSSGNSSGNSSNPSSNPSGNSSGNTPAGTSASISGVLWNDSDGDGAWDSGESATGSRVVFIDSNGNGRLDSGEVSTTSDANGYYKFTNLAAGSYKVSRVFPDGYHLSNSSNAYVTATVATVQQLGDVNLGTTDKNKSSSTPVVSSSPAPTVTSLSLVNAATGKVISGYGDITASESIKLSSLPTRSIAVVANLSSASSVKVSTDESSAIENTAPYAFFGDNNGVFSAWQATAGSYDFSAMAYSGKNGSGVIGNTLSVQLKFI